MAGTKDIILQQTLGELKEANRNIASSLDGIKTNLKTLNDHNILHSEKNESNHQDLLEKIMLMTGRYWWLIISLLITILIVMGYQEAIQFIRPI